MFKTVPSPVFSITVLLDVYDDFNVNYYLSHLGRVNFPITPSFQSPRLQMEDNDCIVQPRETDYYEIAGTPGFQR